MVRKGIVVVKSLSHHYFILIKRYLYLLVTYLGDEELVCGHYLYYVLWIIHPKNIERYVIQSSVEIFHGYYFFTIVPSIYGITGDILRPKAPFLYHLSGKNTDILNINEVLYNKEISIDETFS